MNHSTCGGRAPTTVQGHPVSDGRPAAASSLPWHFRPRPLRKICRSPKSRRQNRAAKSSRQIAPRTVPTICGLVASRTTSPLATSARPSWMRSNRVTSSPSSRRAWAWGKGGAVRCEGRGITGQTRQQGCLWGRDHQATETRAASAAKTLKASASRPPCRKHASALLAAPLRRHAPDLLRTCVAWLAMPSKRTLLSSDLWHSVSHSLARRSRWRSAGGSQGAGWGAGSGQQRRRGLQRLSP